MAAQTKLDKLKNIAEEYFVGENYDQSKALYKRETVNSLTNEEFLEFLDTFSNALSFLAPDIFHKTHPWSREEIYDLFDDTLIRSGAIVNINNPAKLERNLSRSALKLSGGIQEQVNERFNQHLEHRNSDRDYFDSITLFEIEPTENNEFFKKSVFGKAIDYSTNDSFDFEKHSKENNCSGWIYTNPRILNKRDQYFHNEEIFTIENFNQDSVNVKRMTVKDSSGRKSEIDLTQNKELIATIYKQIQNQKREQANKLIV